MKCFYCRVSTDHQVIDRQTKTAEEIGAEKIFIDYKSGKNTDRPQFKEMMNFLREGDILYVSSIDRLSRSINDLLKTVEELNKKGVVLISLKEGINTSNQYGTFLLSIFGALAQLERESINDRVREGVASAKAKGKYKGRKKMNLDEVEFRRYLKEWREGKRTAVSVYKHFNMSANTFYRKEKEFK